MTLALRTHNNFLSLLLGNKGIESHYVLSPRVKASRAGGHLGSRAAVRELKEEILPAFMEDYGSSDVRQQGFRLAIDVCRPGGLPEIHLLAGPSVLSQNPHDWRTPPVQWNPNGPAKFFDLCVGAAGEGVEQMPSGNKIYYSGTDRDIFGVDDGDPKSPVHVLVLARESFSCIMDEGFTTEHLARFLETGYRILETLGSLEQPHRLVINTGQGVQAGPRVHMHVQSSPKGLPSMFPADYGFAVKDGVIQPVAGSDLHYSVFGLIDGRREIPAGEKQGWRTVDACLLRLLRDIIAG